LLSKPSSISTQADLLIEQSKKRIQDITELMKPPAAKVGNTSFDHRNQHQLDKLAKNSDEILLKNQHAQKSTKVMETELKSL